GAGGRLRGIPVPADPAIHHLEAYELARDAGPLLRGERVAPQEIALAHLDDPAEVRFPGRDRIVDVVAVERHLRFEPQRVARAQPARQDTVAAPLLEELAEESRGVLGAAVDLEAVLARVAGARDERRRSRDFGIAEPVVRQVRRIRIADAAHQ